MPRRELEVLEAAGDLAEGVRGDLAVLRGEVRRELAAVRLDEVPDAEHDLGALRERRRPPGRERGLARPRPPHRPPRPTRSRPRGRRSPRGRVEDRSAPAGRARRRARPPIQWRTVSAVGRWRLAVCGLGDLGHGWEPRVGARLRRFGVAAVHVRPKRYPAPSNPPAQAALRRDASAMPTIAFRGAPGGRRVPARAGRRGSRARPRRGRAARPGRARQPARRAR